MNQATSESTAPIMTPELREWLVQQAQARRDPREVLHAMKVSGWQETDAHIAMAKVFSEYFGTQGLVSQPHRPLPSLHWEDQTIVQNAQEDHVGPWVVSVLKFPPIVVLGNFLSDAECDSLVELAGPRMGRSQTVTPATGKSEENTARTSTGMFFERGENALIQAIENRIARIFQWPVDHGEGLQVLRYGQGTEYKPHYDYFDPTAPGVQSLTAVGGQRVGTVIMYLQEPEGGGGTAFPDIGLTVTPKKGFAVFFAYGNPEPLSLSLHAGLPVLRGEKWIATKWLRERKYGS